MEIINQFLAFISKILEWYVIVSPWEQAIFVRHGNKVRLIKAGIYFKIPFIDNVFIQTVRLRNIDLPAQTVSTQDNITLTIKTVCRYSIKDMLQLYHTLYHPETTIQSMIMSSAATYISTHDVCECTTHKIEDYIKANTDLTVYGLGDIAINVVGIMNIKTYRIIQDSLGLYGSDLNMNHKP